MAPGVGQKAAFLLANPAGLLALDSGGGVLGKIVDLPAQSAPATPSLHPSRRSVVFSLTLQPDPKRGFGSDIYTVGLDGKDLRALIEHEKENVFYASPLYDSTGNVLYVHRRAAIVVNGEYKGNEDTIERVDLRSGERRRVLSEAADPALSPDGRTLLFVRLANGQVEGLWRADADGSNARPFLRTRDVFWYLQTPRFSPDGKEIVFSAAGRSTALRPGALARQAHLGIPSELFVSPLDGSAVRSVGQTGDDVVPAWSPDGTRVAYIGTGAFFIVDPKEASTRTIAQGENFFFGDLLWLR